MTNVHMMKCACPTCLCIVEVKEAIIKEELLYCSNTCADQHSDGNSCGHKGCACYKPTSAGASVQGF